MGKPKFLFFDQNSLEYSQKKTKLLRLLKGIFEREQKMEFLQRG